MDITRDQKLWLLTADPVTRKLAKAPQWLIDECEAKGLVAYQDGASAVRLTDEGLDQHRALLAD